jgi:anti-sigma regulatory factor (Ser/Thr protein kinase)
MVLFFEITGMIAIVAAIYIVIIYRYNHVYTASDMRLSIDMLPIPVYFGLPNRLPLVVNNRMYSLIYVLKGKPLTDMNRDFDCLTDSHLEQDDIERELSEKYKNRFFVRFEDHTYLIEKKEFDDNGEMITQISGQDITEEYEHLVQLRKLNEEILQQNLRLKEHFKNVAEINREKELLNAKINIHARLGEGLALMRFCLKHPEDEGAKAEVTGLWEQIILGYTDTEAGNDSSLGDYKELRRVADLAGCSLELMGELPSGDAVAVLVRVLREALNNAIRHAGATALYVGLREFRDKGNVVIYDNGVPIKPFTKPGGGLSNLMEDLEQKGVLMKISAGERFEIELNFPGSYR